MVVSQPLAALLSTVNLLIYLTVRYATLSVILLFVVSPYFATPLLYRVTESKKNNKTKQKKATRHYSLNCCVTLRSAFILYLLLYGVVLHTHSFLLLCYRYLKPYSWHCTLLYSLPVLTSTVPCRATVTQLFCPFTATFHQVPVW